jgi:adenine-specific DNA-methyltransferase
VNRKKLNGSFYTPKAVADFVVDYLATRMRDRLKMKILEPSAGDGAFIDAVSDHPEFSKRVAKVVAIERDKRELSKITFKQRRGVLRSVHNDFLYYQVTRNEKFDLVIGNPPYIKKNHLKERQLRLCKEIHDKAELLDHEPRNIWTAFLVRCVRFTKDDGMMAFILPSEILQVKFAEELRRYLKDNFQRVEYLVFKELVFEAEGQNTVILIAYRRSVEPGVYFGTVDKVQDLATRKFTLRKNDQIHVGATKAVHHAISPDDLAFLNALKGKLNSIDTYCSSKPGIVTAANSYFIVDQDERRKYALGRVTRPIIQRGAFVNGKVEFKSADWQNLSDRRLPCYLVDLNRKVVSHHGPKLQAYLEFGKGHGIDSRYKCQLREKWYRVPNISTPSQALFFKRCHHYPKFLKNVAKVYATDSAYMVDPLGSISVDGLVYSFYNSLTLLFAELHGRYYGGGVLELTPLEFKSLPLPYVNTEKSDFRRFADQFASKEDIMSVLSRNNQVILKKVLNLDQTDIDRLMMLHRHVLLSRLKVSEL